jgi:hypothetical protein
MAGTLVFPVDEKLLRIIAHSQSHPCKKPYTGEAAGPGLFLVKDSGVYLMSAATEPLRVKEGSEGSVVAYAVDHDPSQGDCWEYDREVCGGDDFGEFVDIGDWGDVARLGMKVEVRLTSKTIRVRLTGSSL